MSGFYYWIPGGKPSIKTPELEALGLGYAVEDRHTGRGCDAGPDDVPGVVVCHGDNKDGRLGYWPDKQIWRQIPGSQCWCGFYTEHPPKQEDLIRGEQISGQWVALNGDQWQAPTARKRFEDDGELYWSCNMPRRLTLSEDGSWAPGDVKPRYKRLWDMAMRCEEAFFSEADVPDLDDIAIAALQMNYRVGAIELDMLELYDEDVRTMLINVLIDLDAWVEFIKKKAAAGGGDSSSCG